MTDYYTLRVLPGNPDKIHPSLDIYLNNGGLYLSPSLHLCSPSAMVHLDDPDLAAEFREYSEVRVRQKYGPDSRVQIRRVPATGTPTGLRKLAARIQSDTAKIRERLHGSACLCA